MSEHITDPAVEAAARAFYVNLIPEVECHPRDLANMRAGLEAAYPIMLSHEREQTRLAHLDAVVNAQTVDRLEGQLETASVKWHEAVAEAYVDGALSAAQADTLWLANPYR